MDIIDRVTYEWEWEDGKDLVEETRKAFVNLFDPTSEDARLVARYLIQTCKWEDMTEFNDPIIEAKMNSLRSVILNIKNQLNKKPVVQPEEATQ
jgi:hypothetical protein